MNQPIETLSKNHYVAYNQVIDDYKSLLTFENEMEVWKGFKESLPYERAKSEVKRILARLIENKAFLGWNHEAESIELKKLKN